jgi:uncharacterized membrane protein YagU involved in acid resistance
MQTVQSTITSPEFVAHPLFKRALQAILIAGAVVGVVDAIDGVAYFGITAGNNPLQVLQFIASGALGTRAFSGGLATAGLGALFHFALAYAFTTAFVLLWTQVAVVRREWIVSGLAWGALVWAFMNLIVLPLSNVPQAPLTVVSVVHGVIGHALFVGLTAAIITRRRLSPAK